MAGSRSGAVLRGVRSLFGGGSLVGVGEGALLGRFVEDRDEAAFEALVARHGPMVLGVCRRLLVEPDDVDDAFQATFLVLVKRAGTLRDRELLGNWLYGVARRVAARARSNRIRLRTRERPGGEEAALAKPNGNTPGEAAELRAVLDDELARLPGHLREAVVLCDLEGLPQDEVAGRLGCAVGTIKSRLSRARERLRGRLITRGVAPAALAGGASLAAVPDALGRSTLRAASDLAAGAAGRATALALAEGVAREMTMLKIKLSAGVILLIGLTAGTLAIAARQKHDDPPKRAEAKLTPLPDVATAKRALANWWADIDTLEFRDVTCKLDDKGRPIRKGERPVVEVVLGRGNRRAVTHGTLRDDGSIKVAQDKREDGAIQYYLMSPNEANGRITSATIRDQTNTRDVYHDEMGTMLWLLAPFTSGEGRSAMPLHLHIDNKDTSTRVEIGRDEEGKPTVTLFLAYGGQRVELDPDHDYLPKRVTGDIQEVTVTGFAQKGKHWFPVSGFVTHRQGGRKLPAEYFLVEGLKVNEPIPDSRFEMPADSGEIRVLDRRRVPR
jgi:RNA polymerase sigma factor (sigma-70 family)